MRMPEDLLAALRDKAERDGLTRSAYIRRLLMRHVERTAQANPVAPV